MSQTDIKALCEALESICDTADEMERAFASELASIHPRLRDSARNLVHYVALRHADIRDVQQNLTSLGLSSLGRAERHTKASIEAVLQALKALYLGADIDLETQRREIVQSRAVLARHTRDLLGEKPSGRDVRIMVTLPQDAATNYSMVSQLIDAGMDIARINTAHDDQDTWRGIVENIQRAKLEKGGSCEIVMDLAGPKIRTGQLKPGPRVRRVQPHRDALGHVVAPRRLRLVEEHTVAGNFGRYTLPVCEGCVDDAQAGDQFRFRDTRGKKRKLIVAGADHKGLIVEIYRTAYIATGTKLRLKRKHTGEKRTCRVGALPPIEQPLRLKIGDTLILHRDAAAGEPAAVDSERQTTQAAHISCTPPEVIDAVSPGAAVRLNDGKIEGIVRAATHEELSVEITHAKATGSRLRGGKGIHFPDSDISLTGLTQADADNLPFVASCASAVGLSYVKEPDDVTALQDKLSRLSADKPGIILKIETERAFQNLPRLLLRAMRSYPVGIMIARGDLAVECGWERLAEIQEEILWMCEAARVPVIWATQVLESKTKKGLPSRAEITDAAMAQRADCVMLNKGPYIIKAIRMLDNIVRRMQNHQEKKSPMLRKLSISDVDTAKKRGASHRR